MSDAELWDWVDRQPTHPTHHRPLLPPTVGRRAVQGLCGWELVALCTGILPSVTALIQPHQRRFAVRAGVLVALSVLGHHLLIESPITKEQP